MSFIIVTRNPGTRKLISITDSGSSDDILAEYQTKEEAEKAAKYVPACVAWGYDILEVEFV